MKILIPTVGDEIQLIKDWDFILYFERRNSSLTKQLCPDVKGYDIFNSKKSQQVSLKSGTKLIIDRIYIKKGLSDFD